MTDLCPIVTDLLPLCADHLLSEPSETFVRAHLAQCPDCAARLAALSQPAAELGVPPESVPLRRVHTALRRKRLYASLAALAVCAALLVSLFAFLTAPQIFPYSEDLLTLAALPEVTLNGKPNAIICSTTKGQGVGFMMERPCAWHIGGFDDDKLAEAEKDIKEYTAKKLAEV